MYLPTADHGLSSAVLALSSERLNNEVLIAELALGLSGWVPTGDAAAVATDTERAKTAIARQVNLQVRNAESGNVVSEGKGRQSVTYATVGGVPVAIDPTALLAAQSLLGPGPVSGASEATFNW